MKNQLEAGNLKLNNQEDWNYLNALISESDEEIIKVLGLDK